MNRRHFLQSSAALGLACAAAPAGLLAAPAKPASALRLTLLHTNDTHSRIDPMDTGEHEGLGGVAGRKTMVDAWRAREKHVLLLDAGDVLQGTPYFNLFKGEPEFKAMNELGYLASAIGNHEFDAGIERLAELVGGHARFPFLCCNYGLENTPLLGKVKEYMIQEVDGLRVGILGLGIKLEGLVFPGFYGEVQYRDPIADATRVAGVLKNDEKCDFIIALSHLNIQSRSEGTYKDPQPGDRDLIRSVPEINAIIGGHNHWLLPEPERAYRGEKHPMGYVAQVGWAGTHLGVMQFDLFDEKRIALATGGPTPVA